MLKIAMLGNYPTFLFAEILGCRTIPKLGISTWIVNLSSYLSKIEDIELHIVSEIYPSESIKPFKASSVRKIGYCQSFKSRRINFHFLTPLPRFRATTLFAHDCLMFHQILNNIKPDIVHAHHTDEYSLAAVTSQFPSIVTVHGIYSLIAKTPNSFWISRENILSLVERYILKKGQYFFAINPYLKEFIAQSSFGLLFDLPNPVSDKFFLCPDKTIKSRILFVAILSPYKGVLELLQVAKLVKERHPEIVLHVVGYFTPAYKWYEELVLNYLYENNLEDNVHFLGFKDEDGIAEELTQANCLIVTSKIETASMVIAEAMAAGKPTVAMDVGGIRYTMKNGISGFLVPPGAIGRMAEMIITILEDDSLRKKMGASARQIALERFHPEVISRKAKQVYEEILTMESNR